MKMKRMISHMVTLLFSELKTWLGTGGGKVFPSKVRRKESGRIWIKLLPNSDWSFWAGFMLYPKTQGYHSRKKSAVSDLWVEFLIQAAS